MLFKLSIHANLSHHFPAVSSLSVGNTANKRLSVNVSVRPDVQSQHPGAGHMLQGYPGPGPGPGQGQLGYK